MCETLGDLPDFTEAILFCNKWDKVFKSGLSKFYGRQSLKNFKGYGLLKQTISLQFFKGCPLQDLLSPPLSTFVSRIMTVCLNYIINLKLLITQH